MSCFTTLKMLAIRRVFVLIMYFVTANQGLEKGVPRQDPRQQGLLHSWDVPLADDVVLASIEIN
jgi:hypothetical protein